MDTLCKVLDLPSSWVVCRVLDLGFHRRGTCLSGDKPVDRIGLKKADIGMDFCGIKVLSMLSLMLKHLK